MVVVGAGAFGGWTALHLVRAGVRVTLLDAWGPGNSRSSSGGETRVIRGMYGADRLYVEWVVRAFEQWRELEASQGMRLYTPTTALWMFQGDDAYARSSLPLLAEAGLPAREIPVARAAERFRQIDFSGVGSVFLEEQAGYLAARRACQEVTRAFVAAGGEYRQAAARPVEGSQGRLATLKLSDGSQLAADAFVFACGPWLGELFPEAVGGRIRPTRQEVFFFGTPTGDARYREESLPTWVDFGDRVLYGIPGNEERGFKVADDTHGETVDPTTLERTASQEALARVRSFLRRRFPDLADAPLLESRVCQYETTHDGHLLIDRHPALEDVWLVGGGSGHGYKMGPAVGEHVAQLVLAEAQPLEKFSLARLRVVEAEAEESQLRSGGRS
ncbi:MAG: FAD-dependent oxidoreductase [Thermoanaerobaculia bacterium]